MQALRMQLAAGAQAPYRVRVRRERGEPAPSMAPAAGARFLFAA